jgi:hypothetical protein
MSLPACGRVVCGRVALGVGVGVGRHGGHGCGLWLLACCLPGVFGGVEWWGLRRPACGALALGCGVWAGLTPGWHAGPECECGRVARGAGWRGRAGRGSCQVGVCGVRLPVFKFRPGPSLESLHGGDRRPSPRGRTRPPLPRHVWGGGTVVPLLGLVMVCGVWCVVCGVCPGLLIA